MDRQPNLFIGSSSESAEYAYALQAVLDAEFETKFWRYGVFLPSQNTLASLIDRAMMSDFAALFLTPDDTSIVREEYLKTPRDDVIFELGLFIGHIGLRRVFLLRPNTGVDLPQDLQGINTLVYRVDRSDQDYENAVAAAANGIRTAARRLGIRKDAEAVPTARMPSIEILLALAQLIEDTRKIGATVEVSDANGSGEVIVIDEAGYRSSTTIELEGKSAVQALNELREVVLKDS